MKDNLADLPLGEVIDFNFVGKSEHIMITLKVNKKKNILKGGHNLYTRWIIFNAESGNKDLDISNDPDQRMPNVGLSFDNVGVDDSKEEEKKQAQIDSRAKEECCKVRFVGIVVPPLGTKFGLKRMKRTQTADELTGFESARLKSEEKDHHAHAQLDDSQLEAEDSHEFTDSDDLKTDSSVEEETHDIVRASVDRYTEVDLKLHFIFATDIKKENEHFHQMNELAKMSEE